MRISWRKVGFYCAATLLATGTALAQQGGTGASVEYPSPTVREEQRVIVDGVAETWRLEWAATPKPKPACDARDSDWSTCPCMGFAYGESGDLYLSRTRDGVEVDRLHLTPLFGNEPAQLATVERWPVYDPDLNNEKNTDFPARVSRRRPVQVMHFADYDHDGQATEFYLQIESGPCGKNEGMVVGVTRSNPRLHAWGTVSHPDRPLELQKVEWEALRDASHAVEVRDWSCGDHGADTETTVELYWTGEGIDGARKQYACPAAGEARSLIDQKPL
jgi:hypothetical protein